jgi:hypothetical protein
MKAIMPAEQLASIHCKKAVVGPTALNARTPRFHTRYANAASVVCSSVFWRSACSSLARSVPCVRPEPSMSCQASCAANRCSDARERRRPSPAKRAARADATTSQGRATDGRRPNRGSALGAAGRSGPIRCGAHAARQRRSLRAFQYCLLHHHVCGRGHALLAPSHRSWLRAGPDARLRRSRSQLSLRRPNRIRHSLARTIRGCPWRVASYPPL